MAFPSLLMPSETPFPTMIKLPILTVSSPIFKVSVLWAESLSGFIMVMFPILMMAVPFFDLVVSVCAIICVDNIPNNNATATCFIPLFFIDDSIY